MTIKDAIASCIMQYASSRGRASRAEFWYFVLFIVAASLVVWVLSFVLPPRVAPILQALILVAMAVPLFNVFIRRMHDLGATGLRAILLFIPVIHLLCLWWATKPGEPRENDYGPAPESSRRDLY